MGFIDDVETVLKKTPPTRQIALFSATMPAPIRRIAQTLPARTGRDHDQVEDDHGHQHPPALLVRQRPAQARRADAHPRSRDVRRDARLRAHQAGDRGARGEAAGARLFRRRDQRRHRAGAARAHDPAAARTASSTSWSRPTSPRADSTSSASATCSTTTSRTTPKRTCIASAAPVARAAAARRSCSSRRARSGMLRAIERATRQPIEEMKLPSVEDVNDQRIAKFKQRIGDTLAPASWTCSSS